MDIFERRLQQLRPEELRQLDFRDPDHVEVERMDGGRLYVSVNGITVLRIQTKNAIDFNDHRSDPLPTPIEVPIVTDIESAIKVHGRDFVAEQLTGNYADAREFPCLTIEGAVNCVEFSANVSKYFIAVLRHYLADDIRGLHRTGPNYFDYMHSDQYAGIQDSLREVAQEE